MSSTQCFVGRFRSGALSAQNTPSSALYHFGTTNLCPTECTSRTADSHFGREDRSAHPPIGKDRILVPFAGLVRVSRLSLPLIHSLLPSGLWRKASPRRRQEYQPSYRTRCSPFSGECFVNSARKPKLSKTWTLPALKSSATSWVIDDKKTRDLGILTGGVHDRKLSLSRRDRDLR